MNVIGLRYAGYAGEVQWSKDQIISGKSSRAKPSDEPMADETGVRGCKNHAQLRSGSPAATDGGERARRRVEREQRRGRETPPRKMMPLLIIPVSVLGDRGDCRRWQRTWRHGRLEENEIRRRIWIAKREEFEEPVVPVTCRFVDNCFNLRVHPNMHHLASSRVS